MAVIMHHSLRFWAPSAAIKPRFGLSLLFISLLAGLFLSTSATAKPPLDPIQLSSDSSYHEYLAGQVSFALDPTLEKSVEDMVSQTASFELMDTPYICLLYTSDAADE